MLLLACGQPRLRPAPEAERVSGATHAAVARNHDVTLEARTNTWNGDPPNLADVVTPLHITLENTGSRPIRVQYPEFRLAGPALDHLPLPPYAMVDLSVTVTSPDPVMVPRDPDPSNRFRIPPGRYPDFPERVPWTGPWKMDPGYYEAQYLKWTERLPTVEMIQQSLPEGVLEPGGRVSGFLYFEKLPHTSGRLSLRVDLVDAETELTLGTLQIPFVNR
jgi:hypothetical protein